MVTLPPHTSHRTQPLDVTFFGPLKACFNRQCDLLMKNEMGRRITVYEIAELVHKAFVKSATMEKGEKGFRIT